MIKTYCYSPDAANILEEILKQDDFRLNHVIIPAGKFFPKHPTDGLVTVIIISGQLSVAINENKPEVYSSGRIIEIQKNVMSVLGNPGSLKTELFIIKRKVTE